MVKEETPATIPPKKHQQLDAYLWTKHLWEHSRVSLRKLSNIVEQNIKNYFMKKQGKWLPISCIIPFPRPVLLSSKRELPNQKEFPASGEGKQLPQLFEDCLKDLLPFHSTQSLVKLRWIEMARKKKRSDCQYQPCSGNDHSSQRSTLQKTQEAFITEET